MSTRNAWVDQLAHEIKTVAKTVPGWEVAPTRKAGGGYSIHAPDGYKVELHQTKSDINGEAAFRRVLNQHGYAQARKRHERQLAADRRAALAADKAANAKALAKAAERAKAVTRAAGPYAGPQELPYDWYATAHPAPAMQFAHITAAMAEKILDNLNTSNRPMSPRVASGDAKVMAKGGWKLTHQAIAFDTTGKLQDGQHRLRACVESGAAIDIPVFVGMDPDNYPVIDEGYRRQSSQLLASRGERYTSALAGAIRLLLAVDDPNPRTAWRERATNAIVVAHFAEHSEHLREVTTWGVPVGRALGIHHSALIAARVAVERVNGRTNPYVKAFFDGLAEGGRPVSRVMLPADDPRARLRAYMANRDRHDRRVSNLGQMSLVVRAWNYVCEDSRPRFLRWSGDNAIVRPSLCTPTGRNPSPPPPMLADELAEYEWAKP